jgi:membrane protein
MKGRKGSIRHDPTGWRAIWRVVWPAVDHFVSDKGFIYAGYIAFTSIFALFPFLIFLLTLAGFMGQSEAAAASIELAYEILPPEVVGVLRPVVEEIRTHASTRLLTVSILLTLWFSSSGFESLRVAVNLAHGVHEYPHFLWSRLQSIALTVLSAVIVILAMLALVVGPVLGQVVAFLSQGKVVEPDIYALLRQAIGGLLLLGLFSGLYAILPHVNVRASEIFPGAVVGAALWMISAKIYSLYLQNLSAYTVTYGSLAGIVLTLFFFYISAIIFIFGAQLNGAFRRQRKRWERRVRTLAEADPEIPPPPATGGPDADRPDPRRSPGGDEGARRAAQEPAGHALRGGDQGREGPG